MLLGDVTVKDSSLTIWFSEHELDETPWYLWLAHRIIRDPTPGWKDVKDFFCELSFWVWQSFFFEVKSSTYSIMHQGDGIWLGKLGFPQCLVTWGSFFILWRVSLCGMLSECDIWYRAAFRTWHQGQYLTATSLDVILFEQGLSNQVTISDLTRSMSFVHTLSTVSLRFQIWPDPCHLFTHLAPFRYDFRFDQIHVICSHT